MIAKFLREFYDNATVFGEVIKFCNYSIGEEGEIKDLNAVWKEQDKTLDVCIEGETLGDVCLYYMSDLLGDPILGIVVQNIDQDEWVDGGQNHIRIVFPSETVANIETEDYPFQTTEYLESPTNTPSVNAYLVGDDESIDEEYVDKNSFEEYIQGQFNSDVGLTSPYINTQGEAIHDSRIIKVYKSVEIFANDLPGLTNRDTGITYYYLYQGNDSVPINCTITYDICRKTGATITVLKENLIEKGTGIKYKTSSTGAALWTINKTAGTLDVTGGIGRCDLEGVLSYTDYEGNPSSLNTNRITFIKPVITKGTYTFSGIGTNNVDDIYPTIVLDSSDPQNNYVTVTIYSDNKKFTTSVSDKNKPFVSGTKYTLKSLNETSVSDNTKNVITTDYSTDEFDKYFSLIITKSPSYDYFEEVPKKMVALEKKVVDSVVAIVDTAGKNPLKEGWYEKSTYTNTDHAQDVTFVEYKKTKDVTPSPSKSYVKFDSPASTADWVLDKGFKGYNLSQEKVADLNKTYITPSDIPCESAVDGIKNTKWLVNDSTGLKKISVAEANTIKANPNTKYFIESSKVTKRRELVSKTTSNLWLDSNNVYKYDFTIEARSITEVDSEIPNEITEKWGPIDENGSSYKRLVKINLNDHILSFYLIYRRVVESTNPIILYNDVAEEIDPSNVFTGFSGSNEEMDNALDSLEKIIFVEGSNVDNYNNYRITAQDPRILFKYGGTGNPTISNNGIDTEKYFTIKVINPYFQSNKYKFTVARTTEGGDPDVTDWETVANNGLTMTDNQYKVTKILSLGFTLPDSIAGDYYADVPIELTGEDSVRRLVSIQHTLGDSSIGSGEAAVVSCNPKDGTLGNFVNGVAVPSFAIPIDTIGEITNLNIGFMPLCFAKVGINTSTGQDSVAGFPTIEIEYSSDTIKNNLLVTAQRKSFEFYQTQGLVSLTGLLVTIKRRISAEPAWWPEKLGDVYIKIKLTVSAPEDQEKGWVRVTERDFDTLTINLAGKKTINPLNVFIEDELVENDEGKVIQTYRKVNGLEYLTRNDENNYTSKRIFITSDDRETPYWLPGNNNDPNLKIIGSNKILPDPILSPNGYYYSEEFTLSDGILISADKKVRRKDEYFTYQFDFFRGFTDSRDTENDDWRTWLFRDKMQSLLLSVEPENNTISDIKVYKENDSEEPIDYIDVSHIGLYGFLVDSSNSEETYQIVLKDKRGLFSLYDNTKPDELDTTNKNERFYCHKINGEPVIISLLYAPGDIVEKNDTAEDLENTGAELIIRSLSGSGTSKTLPIRLKKLDVNNNIAIVNNNKIASYIDDNSVLLNGDVIDIYSGIDTKYTTNDSTITNNSIDVSFEGRRKDNGYNNSSLTLNGFSTKFPLSPLSLSVRDGLGNSKQMNIYRQLSTKGKELKLPAKFGYANNNNAPSSFLYALKPWPVTSSGATDTSTWNNNECYYRRSKTNGQGAYDVYYDLYFSGTHKNAGCQVVYLFQQYGLIPISVIDWEGVEDLFSSDIPLKADNTPYNFEEIIDISKIKIVNNIPGYPLRAIRNPDSAHTQVGRILIYEGDEPEGQDLIVDTIPTGYVVDNSKGGFLVGSVIVDFKLKKDYYFRETWGKSLKQVKDSNIVSRVCFNIFRPAKTYVGYIALKQKNSVNSSTTAGASSNENSDWTKWNNLGGNTWKGGFNSGKSVYSLIQDGTTPLNMTTVRSELGADPAAVGYSYVYSGDVLEEVNQILSTEESAVYQDEEPDVNTTPKNVFAESAAGIMSRVTGGGSSGASYAATAGTAGYVSASGNNRYTSPSPNITALIN